MRKTAGIQTNIKCTVNLFYGAFFIISLFFIPCSSFSQAANISQKPGSVFGLKQSVLNETGEKLRELKMKKSPLRAALYSAVLPGAGQFYNESYWKIPIIAAAGAYFVYEIIDNNKKYNDYKDRYIASQTPENPAGNPQFRTNRDFYRDQRDNFFIYSAILYIINIADAYVDAHLYDFDVSDEIKMGFFKKNGFANFSLVF